MRDTHVLIWASAHLVFWYAADSDDGLHMGNETLRQNTQILLNFHCNREIRHRDATCCAPRELLSTMQIAALTVFGVFTAIAIVLVSARHGPAAIRGIRMRLKLYQPVPVYQNGNAFHDKLQIQDGKMAKKVLTGYDVLYEISFAMAKLGLIMGYFILCDRTDFFMKENKYYSNINFFVPLTYIFLLGMFFSEKSDQVSISFKRWIESSRLWER